LLDELLAVAKGHQLIKERGYQRTDSTQIQAAIRRINRLEKVGETLRAALNRLASLDGAWLKSWVPADWYRRYGTRLEESRLPRDEGQRQALALQIGADGYQLLTRVDQSQTRIFQQDQAILTLRRVWIQEYYQQDEAISWRGPDDTPPSEERIDSPYDPQARYSEKRGQGWVGYKIHLTETCESTDTPHLIVQVETTPAPEPDYAAVPTIQQNLAQKDCLPDEHLLDQGYMSISQVTLAERTWGIHMLGHPMPDSSWQAKAKQGFDLPSFQIDWEKQVVTCPMQHLSHAWRSSKTAHGEKSVYRVEFAARDCLPCPQRVLCTQNEKGGRNITIRPQTEHEALQKLRQAVQTEAFKAKYRKRAGVEGTLSQGVRGYHLRRARYIGLAKVHLQHLATAAAINLARLFAWFTDVPMAKTRVSTFASLAVPSA
jgi:transposase